ncbi:hypothetical protein [Desulfosporosinus sp.]|uniref:hypothetical protein n=1 Tax=Desulfosporosinus sp. TaxID=157907 RepID=UPI0025C59D2D|nr:hypothetical protein [Desulfosporosinus sp.]MBC2721866.1 hypothetical protein [Desulfosporosinus sp.]MBC2726882.1 hypothetical protein [Desulfosporosinus sp.]
MAFSLSEIKVKPIAKSSTNPLWRRLSLRSLRGIIVGVFACVVIMFIMLWQPAYYRLDSLREEKTHWEKVLKTGVTYTGADIPTMDQLPAMIELCRGEFVNQGVDVVSLNVERFGERREVGKGASIDYSLVRLRLHGQWQGIVSALKALEEMQEVSVHAQEVVLAKEGGEALLQIYFCSGDYMGIVR